MCSTKTRSSEGRYEDGRAPLAGARPSVSEGGNRDVSTVPHDFVLLGSAAFFLEVGISYPEPRIYDN